MRTVMAMAMVMLHSLSMSAAVSFSEELRIQPIAHRGLLRHAPENTPANFNACRHLRLGFEFDVRRSKDDTLICLHDDTVDRTTNGKGPALEKTDAELRQLDAGSWFDPAFKNERIPTIDQVFGVIAEYPNDDVTFTADLKGDDEKLEQDIVELAQRRKVLNRILFIGRAIDHPDVRARLRKADPQCHVACLAQTKDDLEEAIQDRTSDWVYLRFVPDAATIAKIRAANKRSIIAGAKVSGEETENWKLSATAGVNLILTDFPLELQQVIKGMGTISPE